MRINPIFAALVAGSLIAAATATALAQSAPPRNADDWLLNASDDTARFRLLQQYLRGFSMPMWEVGYRYQRVYDAIGDQNYDLAAYHWSKIKDAIVLGYTKRPGRRDNAEKEFLNTVFQPTLDAIKSGDRSKAAEAFATARKACMSCHEKERVAFMNNQPLFRATETRQR